MTARRMRLWRTPRRGGLATADSWWRREGNGEETNAENTETGRRTQRRPRGRRRKGDGRGDYGGRRDGAASLDLTEEGGRASRGFNLAEGKRAQEVSWDLAQEAGSRSRRGKGAVIGEEAQEGQGRRGRRKTWISRGEAGPTRDGVAVNREWWEADNAQLRGDERSFEEATHTSPHPHTHQKFSRTSYLSGSTVRPPPRPKPQRQASTGSFPGAQRRLRLWLSTRTPA